MSPGLLEDSGLDEQPCPALPGLPAQVKVLETEMDSVVSLEELAMRFLHRVQQQPAGEPVRVEGFVQDGSVSSPQLRSERRRCCAVITELLDENCSFSGGRELLQLLQG